VTLKRKKKPMPTTRIHVKDLKGWRQKLAAAVRRKMGPEDTEEFYERLEEITKYGADLGVPGFIYYEDTVAFAEKWLDEIKELCREYDRSVVDCITGFGIIKKDKDITREDIERVVFERDKNNEHYIFIMNLLAWFALEEVARWLTND